MPPIPDWLRQELKKVKITPDVVKTPLSGSMATLPTASMATLPSIDSFATSGQASTIVASEIPEEEIKQLLFLREQMSGCAPTMRGNIEELWQTQQDRERERAHLRTARIRDASRRERDLAREQRLKATEVEGTLDPRVPSLEELPRRTDRQLSSQSAKSPRDNMGNFSKSPRQASGVRGKVEKVTRRITVLNFIRHHTSLEQRNGAMDRLRQELKKRVREQIFAKHRDQELEAITEERDAMRSESESPRPTSKLKNMKAQAATDPAIAAWLEAFQRYDTDGTGFLDAKEVRAALGDIGIEPAVPTEKRAMQEKIVDEMRRPEAAAGLDFDGFATLVPRLKEAVQESMRDDLEEWFERGLNKTGVYEIKALQSCLEAFGCVNVIGDAEWAEVQKIFSEVGEKAIAEVVQVRAESKRPTTSSSGRPNTGSEKALPPPPAPKVVKTLENVPNPFDAFETIFFKSKERLNALRRMQERDLATKMQLTDTQFASFRSELIEFNAIFQKFDEDSSNALDEEECARCLAVCGLQRGGSGLEDDDMRELMIHAKLRTEDERLQLKWSTDSDPDFSGHPRYEELLNTDTLELNFAEFLMLMLMVRNIHRKAQQPELQEVFDSYDLNHSGYIDVKECIGLLDNIGLTPKSREEQVKIRMIWDEVDENGDGSFSFNEFQVLVHRVQEHLDRLTRKEEEDYATGEIGMSLKRCRELRDLFAGNLANGSSVLSVAGLRQVTEELHLRYTSEELLTLFQEFCREEARPKIVARGENKCLPREVGVDGKGFLRMMHCIDEAKRQKTTSLQGE